MSDQILETSDGQLASFRLEFEGVAAETLANFTPMEIVLGESLLTPGLQTSVRVHAWKDQLPLRILDDFKDKIMEINIQRPILQQFKLNDYMQIRQTTYRCDNRRLINNNIEEFILHACDQTLLDDAATLVSKYWKCTTPSAVTREVLTSCAGAKSVDVEDCDPARDYAAENIHPFQVVAQQANAALAAGNDPSFVHYMTYENLGTHHFKSLYRLTRQPSIMTYMFSETGDPQGYGFPHSIMTHAFPCDFDLLSDILNGVNSAGEDINTLMTFNPLIKSFNMFGNKTYGCGIGSAVVKSALSNAGSAAQQNSCPDYSQLYLQKRQARMGLLEQDKIALRLTVPWYPDLHAGKIITVEIPNKSDPEKLNYGSGDYLIVSLKHIIKYGGFATTTMDCVSRTVGIGVV